jgi:GntR family transcriptional regulator
MQTSRPACTITGMSSSPADARSIQERIADRIRAEIETGYLVAGEQLPTIDKLAEDHSCSAAPVRAALEILKQEGLIVARQGIGTFVRSRPTARRHGMERYSRSVWQSGALILTAEAGRQGLKADQVMRYIGDAPAPARVAERLGVALGAPVHVRKRTTLIEGRENQLADSYYALDVADAAPMLREEKTGPGGGFARLEDAGFILAEIEEEIAVRMPTNPESVSLHLPGGTPVVDLVRTVYDTTGRAVEVMLAVIAGDMVSFSYRFPVPD